VKGGLMDTPSPVMSPRTREPVQEVMYPYAQPNQQQTEELLYEAVVATVVAIGSREGSRVASPRFPTPR